MIRSFLILTACVSAIPMSAHAADAPKISEPMVFDLVRPLGAKRGELEVNTLGQRNHTKGYSPLEWAPEIEYAVADGLAVELELPLEGRHVTDYKLGLQGTLGTFARGRAVHGIQYLGLHSRELNRWESSLLYILGARYSKKWSTLSMVGVGDVAFSGPSDRSLLLNHSTFYDVSKSTTLGVEINFRDAQKRSTLLMPQVQHSLSKNLQVQAGLGAIQESGEKWRPRLGLRVIRQLK